MQNWKLDMEEVIKKAKKLSESKDRNCMINLTHLNYKKCPLATRNNFEKKSRDTMGKLANIKNSLLKHMKNFEVPERERLNRSVL
mmetsp:Transcript_1306/g.1347  ORF Transcript_1306/g.1347 Transcript_1306/m.1347 type:complete len:85 (+) Transcript_1306:296-550(+)